MKKPDAVPFSNRRLSFNLGGGLQGLTKPPSHQYSNSASSSASQHNGAPSPASSYASAMSPPPFPARGPGHQRSSSVSTTPSHAALRTQAGSSSQMMYDSGSTGTGTPNSPDGVSSGAPDGSGLAQQGFQILGKPIPPISPAGIPSQQPTFLNPSCQQAGQSPFGPSLMDGDTETHESPAQQLRQQLRRISDPMEPSFRKPRSRGHTPRNSLNQLPRLRTPSQPELNVQAQRTPSETLNTTSSDLAANGVAVREFPETPADKQDLVEKMMLDLRRASMQSQGLDTPAGSYGTSADY